MPNESNECPQNNRFEVIYIKLIISYLWWVIYKAENYIYVFMHKKYIKN
jgi:hypothetical protein